MRSTLITIPVLLLFLTVEPCTEQSQLQRLSAKEFVALIEQLSEEPGFFDSDNLVSNEASYLQVFGNLERLGIVGGTYLGVGPEQNFSYIAKTRPRLAILIDIRRQNLLYHLLFKWLFDISANRYEYLGNLFCRYLVAQSENSSDEGVSDLFADIERCNRSEELFETNAAKMRKVIKQDYGFPLSQQDERMIEQIYREFFEEQLEIRFHSFGRPSFAFYPTFKEISLERDLSGRRGNYLNSEADFQFLKTLQARNLIVPVVGDFAGSKALLAISNYLRQIGQTVSVFYVSNVEFYLLQNRVFGQYGTNVSHLPISEHSFLIRAYFRFPHPERRPGYISATVLQPIHSFLTNLEAGNYRNYRDLGSLDFLGNE